MARKPSRPEPLDPVIQEVQDRFKECQDRESGWRTRAKDDLRFVEGDSYNNDQWPAAIVETLGGPSRGNRPMLTINKTRQHCLQIINDCQQNAMGIKVNATGYGASEPAADALEGIIRHIEYASNAGQNAYRNAINGQVKVGMGWAHITRDYEQGDTFDQQILIKAIPDPLSVYSDTLCREPDHSDMQWAMIVQDMAKEQFERDYPGHEPNAGFSEFDGMQEGWITENTVRVCRYYRRSETEKTIWAIPKSLAPQGQAPGQTPSVIADEADIPDETLELAKAAKYPSRKVKKPLIEWFDIAGHEVLDHGDTPFDYIPVVPWVGEEVLVDGHLDRKGHVRALIDAQRMYNYAASRYVEFTALQTRAPWVVDVRSIEGHEDSWNSANSGTPPAYLPFNSQDPDTGQQLSPPQRVDPPPVDAASIQGMTMADQQMQMATGQYEATMGAPSNEKSGFAIQQRQRQSDRATYHFTDNQGAALRLMGRIIISAIPRVYDQQRAIQVLGVDGTRQGVVIDPNLQHDDGRPAAHKTIQPPMVPAQPVPGAPPPPPGAPPPMKPIPDPNDPSQPASAILAVNPKIGRYDVEADVGPAYATRRQEAFNAFSQLISAMPQLGSLVGDLAMQSADFPLADEAAERLKRMVPPQALGEGDAATAGLQAQIQGLSAQLKAANDKQAIEQGKLQIAAQDAKTDQFKAQTDRLAAIAGADPALVIGMLRQMVGEMMGTMGHPGLNMPHPHDPSLGGPPAGTMMNGAGQIAPIPSIQKQSTPIRPAEA